MLLYLERGKKKQFVKSCYTVEKKSAPTLSVGGVRNKRIEGKGKEEQSEEDECASRA